jgi:3-deoxy-manno-octulosonate cytidylyltransferase (CMP-KDO synthetase)
MDHSKSNVIAVIPARYHSNRFEGKPLAPILGKSMIQHVVERAWQVDLLSRVVVATDDERIASVVESFGGEVVMTRPDHASGTDRLAEAAELIDISEQDIVVNIQGDQPLFPAEVVEQVARPMLDDPALPMSTLIYKIVRPEEIDDPNHVKTVFDRNGNALYFSRASIPFQRNPDEPDRPTYYKHLGFYAYRKGFLLTFVSLPEGEWERFEKLEQLRALEYGYTIKVVLTEHDSIEVDTPRDIERVEALLS